MNTFTMIARWNTIFSVQRDSLPAHIFALSFSKPAADFIANQKQTQSDVPKQTHLTAQTPVWQGVIDSTTPERSERHNQTSSQEAESTLRYVNQLHQQSRGKSENI